MISPQPQGGSGYNDLAAEKKMAVTLEKNLHHDQASDYVTYDHVAETIVEMGHRMLEDESADAAVAAEQPRLERGGTGGVLP